MESHEILKRAVSTMGVKCIASDMKLSSSLIYKWCQPKDSPDSAGADNPLDRLLRLCQLTGDTAPIEWLCQKADGFFVKNPPEETESETDPLNATQGILSDFSQLLTVVSKSIEDDRKIDGKEAGQIREVWEVLKSVTESFVVACESGIYAQVPFNR